MSEVNNPGMLSENSQNPPISLGPSYDELFDFTDYCEYPDWRTVLSLAAYFVDLMRITANDVELGEDAYSLKDRRPDLWTLELDRQNTETVIPALDVVLEVLGEHICPTAENGENTNGSAAANASLASRKADHDAQVYQELAASVYPFNLPFNHSLAQIRQCLAQQGTGLPQIWETLVSVHDKNSILSISREILGLSPAQWSLYSAPETSDAQLNTFFGLPADTTSTVEALTPVDVFLEKAGLSNDQLNQLLYQDLSATELEAGENATFFINVGTDASDPPPIGIDVSERDGEQYKELTNLTNSRLDHINRFVRLAWAVDRPFADLEWALRTIALIVGNEHPEIDDAALPFLAWMRRNQNQAGLTINQLCACIGVLKDSGGAGGPTFFDSVFNNPNIPEPPADWYAATWIVPKSDHTASASSDADDPSVQAALQAALQVGESQLVAMGNLVLQALDVKTRELPLAPQNLGILYRLSHLPAICGLPFEQCLIAIGLPGLQSVDDKSSDLILGGAAANETLPLFMLLRRLSDWLKTSKISLPDLQYGLTGRSENVSLQNKIPGREAVVNFLNNFHNAFRPSLATKSQFSNAVIGMVQGLTPAGQTAAEVVQQLWDLLLIDDTEKEDDLGWINKQRIVVAVPSVDEIVTEIKPILNPNSSDEGAVQTEGVMGLADLIQKFLIQSFELQQAAQNSALGGLAGLSQTLVSTLSYWAAKTLGVDDIYELSDPEAGGNEHALITAPSTWLEKGWEALREVKAEFILSVSDSPHPNIQPDQKSMEDAIGKVKTFLCLLYRYAYLARTMRLSSAEARSIIFNASRYGVANSSQSAGFKLTFQNIRTFWEFRCLEQTYQDTQNHLLNYLDSSADTLVTELAESLADIILMDPSDVAFLMQNLWPATEQTEEEEQETDNPPPGYLTVAGVKLIAAYQKTAAETAISIPTLFALVQMADQFVTEPYPSLEINGLASTIWGSLQSHYREQPEVIDNQRNALNQVTRDAMLGLVKFNLIERGIPTLTVNDLYSYLLLDVEVTSAVETTRVLSAVSSVQLYINRSVNNVEPDVTVTPELLSQWPWMKNYRTWQANRQVFLYPENYIQPELLPQGSDLYEQLVNDLLGQSNLSDPASITETFQKYLDGFSLVANLRVVGAAVRDFTDDDRAFKEVGLVGQTLEQPVSYYFRTAIFARQQPGDPSTATSNWSGYIPVDWRPWQSIGQTITAAGPVTPVFAFAKWFLFWVEEQQSGSEGDSDGSEQTPTYNALLHYTFQTFNRSWTTPQKLQQIGLGTVQISTMATADKPFWDRIYPAFFNAAQLIMVPYGQPDNHCYLWSLSADLMPVDPINYGLSTACRYVLDYRPSGAGGEEQDPLTTTYSCNGASYTYCIGPQSMTELVDFKNIWAYSNWFEVARLPSTGDETIVTINVSETETQTIAVNSSGQILVNGESTEVALVIGHWYQLVFAKKKLHSETGELPLSCPPSSGYPGYSAAVAGSELFLGYDTNGELAYTYLENNEFVQGINVASPGPPTGPPSITYFPRDESLYMAYQIMDDIWYAVIKDPTDINKKDTSYSKLFETKLPPVLIVWSDQVYLFGYDSEIFYFDMNLRDFNDLGSSTRVSPGLAIRGKDVLYLAGVDSNLNIFFGFLYNPSDTSINGYTTLDEHTDYSPSIVNFLEHLYIAWSDLDGYLNIGWVVDSEGSKSSTVQDKRTFVEMGASATSPVLFVYKTQLKVIWDRYIYTVATSPINSYIASNNASIPVTPIQMPTDYESIDFNVAAISGPMQEVLAYDKGLSDQAFEDLHTDSVGRITRDISTSVPLDEAFGNPEAAAGAVPVIGQPNWAKISGGSGQFLATETTTVVDQGQLVCSRLNSTAFYRLGQTLFAEGVSALLSLESQRSEESPFEALVPNTALVPMKFWPPATIDFHLTGALSDYYWELFFYAPFLIANELTTAQKFEDAQGWYRYIFNPTVTPENADLAPGENPNDRFWRFRGLRSGYNLILSIELGEEWLAPLDQAVIDAVRKADWQAQLYAYENDPFDPQAVARLRPIAYQITLFMKYVDNLIQWGDALNRVYTVESLSEAMMLYVEAQDLLGPDPESVGACPLTPIEDIDDFIDDYGTLRDIPEFLIRIETDLSAVPAPPAGDLPYNYLDNIYFGIPENPQFLTYWDVVAQRIYNINHGLNIDGRVQQPALLAPPIDPNQLVAQAASGQEVGATPAALQVDVPYYRFDVMIERAQRVTSTVAQLGQALLSALQNQDAEALSLLYNTNEQTLMNQTTTMREDQLQAAEDNVKALQTGLAGARARLDFYTGLIDNGLLAGEKAEITLQSIALGVLAGKLAVQGVSIAGFSMPNIFGLAMGGMQIGDAINAGANIAGTTVESLNASAGLSGLNAGFTRRDQDWGLQKTLARDDVDQIQYQILAAQCQQRIAEREIDLLNTQLEQAQTVAYFLTTKFTSRELYQWMAGKLSTLYSQSYQLAYDLALSAQRAWQFERCDDSQVFISSGSWNSLYQGLTAGDALQFQLQSMEAAYLSQNARPFEIRKTISLQQFDPRALLDLRDNGSCMFELTEKDFDYDYPGQYCRQIKSITLSFPALVGPYQNLHAVLTQTSNKVLMLPDDEAVNYLLNTESGQIPASNVLRQDWRANQQIALSQGLDDSGLFVMNFDDPRYLPYESTGAISSWTLELPRRTNPINFNSITNVVIQLNYTAVAGPKSFQDDVIANMGDYAGTRLFPMASEYPNAWYGFINAGSAGAQEQEMSFPISEASFPMNLEDYVLDSFYIQLVLTENGREAADGDTLPTLILTAQGQEAELEFPLIYKDGVVMSGPETPVKPPTLTSAEPVICTLAVKGGPSDFLCQENVLNLTLIIGYQGALLPM